MIYREFIYKVGNERKIITFKIAETGITYNFSDQVQAGTGRTVQWYGSQTERYYTNVSGVIEQNHVISALKEVIFNWDGENAIEMSIGDSYHDPFSEIPNYEEGRPSTIPNDFGQTLYIEGDGGTLKECGSFQWFTALDRTVNPAVDRGFCGGFGNIHKIISGVDVPFSPTDPMELPFGESATPKVSFWLATMHDDVQSSPTYGQDFDVLIQAFNPMLDSLNPGSSFQGRAVFTDMRLIAGSDQVEHKTDDGKRNVTPYGRRGTYNFNSDKMTDTEPTGYSIINRWEHGLTLYHINDYQVEGLMDEFFGGNTLWNKFTNAINKPIQGIITLHKMPITVPSGGKSQKLTILGTPMVHGQILSQVPLVNDQLVKVPGTPKWVPIEEIYGDFFDYAGESSLSVYLPFIGTIPIDVNKVMNGGIKTVYYFDVLTGNCIARVYGKNDMNDGEVLLYQGTGNAALHIPYVGNDQGGMKQLGALAGIASAGLATAALGGAATAPAMAAITGISASVTAEKNATINNIPTECNPLSYPYVCYIQQYPERVMADLQLKISGWGASSGKEGTTVNNYKGVVVGKIKTKVSGATDAEKAEIERLFAGGVIV